jgi:hypothetical protein
MKTKITEARQVGKSLPHFSIAEGLPPNLIRDLLSRFKYY